MAERPDGSSGPNGSGGTDGSGLLVVGVDAGGTSTRAGLADARGTVLRTGRAGPGNALSVPPRELARTLAQALAGAVPEEARDRVRAVVGGFAGASADDFTAAAAADGAAGLGGPMAAAALAEAVHGLGMAPDVVQVRGDVDVAFASAPGAPGDGLALIAGTGAVAARVAARRLVAAVDGHGWLLGDAGSGFWIGRRAVRAVLRTLDGRGTWTALVPAVTGHLTGCPLHDLPAAGRERRDAAAVLVAAAQSRPPVRLGLLCPLVVTAAADGDETAVRILDAAADRLIDTLGALTPRAGETLVTTGGLLGPGGPLVDRVRERTAPLGLHPVPVPDGIQGACVLAAKAAGSEGG